MLVGKRNVVAPQLIQGRANQPGLFDTSIQQNQQ